MGSKTGKSHESATWESRMAEGGIKVNIAQELIDRAKRDGLTGAQLVCLALQIAMPDANDIEVSGQRLPPGYVA